MTSSLAERIDAASALRSLALSLAFVGVASCSLLHSITFSLRLVPIHLDDCETVSFADVLLVLAA